MFQGNWKCSQCGGTISELPFEPRSEQGLRCRDCHAKGRSGSGQTATAERKRFSGQWSCSGCNTAITELPFEPRDTSNLLCLNCYRQQKGG